MPKYTLSLEIANAGNATWEYHIELASVYEEQNPNSFFSKQNRIERQQLCQALEAALQRQALPEQIDKVLEHWCKAIRAGDRRAVYRTSLPPVSSVQATAAVPYGNTSVGEKINAVASSVAPSEASPSAPKKVPSTLTDLKVKQPASQAVDSNKMQPPAPQEEKSGRKISDDDLS